MDFIQFRKETFHIKIRQQMELVPNYM